MRRKAVRTTASRVVSRLVHYQRMDVVLTGQVPARMKVFQLDEEAHPDNLATQPLNEGSVGLDRSASRQKIGDQQHLVTMRDGVLAYLNGIGLVLLVIAQAMHFRWQFALLSDRDEPHAELVRYGGAHDESSGLVRRHEVDVFAAEGVGHLPHTLLEGMLVPQQGRDVPEHYTFELRDPLYLRLEIHDSHTMPVNGQHS